MPNSEDVAVRAQSSDQLAAACSSPAEQQPPPGSASSSHGTLEEKEHEVGKRSIMTTEASQPGVSTSMPTEKSGTDEVPATCAPSTGTETEWSKTTQQMQAMDNPCPGSSLVASQLNSC